MKVQTLIFVLFALLAHVQAQNYLHVSTIPSNVDIYTGVSRVDFADEPSYRSPAFIPVYDGEITLHLFHPEFADTTIHVKVPDKDTSFLIVSMRSIYDESLMEEQQDFVDKRGRRSLGKRLMFASIVPFFVGGVAAIVSYYQIGEANDAKKTVERSSVKGDAYRAAESDFKHARHLARNARNVSFAGVGFGAAFLVLGFAISF